MFVLASEVPFGVKMLWASVVRRAIFDYVLYKGVGSQAIVWKRAFQYLFVEGQRYENGYSFEEACDLFNWEPGYLRRLIVKLTRADIRRMENDRVKQDFIEDNELEYLRSIQSTVAELVRNTGTWTKHRFAVPYLPPTCYSEAYEQEMTPKLVKRETYFQSAMPPMVQWQTAVA